MLLSQTFFKSLKHALSGIRYTIREERNFQLEIIAAVLSIMAAFFFPLTLVERLIIFLLVGVILALELFNTAFERLLDMLKPRIHPYVKVVKDVVAGAVLIVSVTALVIGVFIFAPYIWILLW